MTARHGAAVLGALARAVPRGPILLGTGAALAGVAAAAGLSDHRGAVLALQASTVALAGAAVTLLDEPALDAVPTTLARRRALLLGAGLPLLALVWMALLAVGGVSGEEAPVLTLQLAAVTSLALGLGARGGDPVRALVGVALAFGIARVLFGPQLFPAGTEAAHWDGAARVWAGAAGAGLLLLAVFSRDAVNRSRVCRRQAS
jgi:hypothetical protein